MRHGKHTQYIPHFLREPYQVPRIGKRGNAGWRKSKRLLAGCMHTSLAHNNTANTTSTRKLLQRYTALGTSLPSFGWRMDNSAAIGVSELSTAMVFPTVALVLGKQRVKKGQINPGRRARRLSHAALARVLTRTRHRERPRRQKHPTTMIPFLAPRKGNYQNS
ncbi:unnamed protein product, partial [Ectocarpus sp. 13 AM-2016]